MLSLTSTLALCAAMIGATMAVTSISDTQMTTLLNEGGVGLAMAAQPMWFFGQAMNRPPCIPTHAVVNEQQTPGAELCEWPDAGCNCRKPGVGIGNPAPDFPVYYSYSKCNDNEVRVAYNLFYEKDGFTPSGVFGHKYDWERVIVVWTKDSASNWQPSQLLLSQHSGYDRKNWGDIQNTFSTVDATLPRGGDNGRKNLDHPKVYVAWSKHAIYRDRNTGWNDVLSQLTNNAFRSQDWWHYHVSSSYIRADGSTEIGKQMAGMDWGSATSHPASVHNGLCSA
ncbi:uncharacterized protein CLUP02_13326 [Colletotrichum lupini]|uniref:Uncharacterized protein n=1 Tax=Colletotrichum lupini TaxID=145971 RepID=A0A9Q8T427_9PEZI|nr:uncharacterized protein CLUP02_13326 [Colletotrichum lupini]UQC87806.1 hypothetical protein CLUP02_13326 [Colletotrichum lupini]